MRNITLIYPYYENPQMLKVQLNHFAGIPSDLKPYVSINMCDDCSQDYPAMGVIDELNGGHTVKIKSPIATNYMFGMPFRLFKILVDVRWNWIAARNLCVDKCETEWFIMTDMDHMIPYDTLRHLITFSANPNLAYKFDRKDAYICDYDGSMQLNAVKSHPNTWFMTKAMFERVGGYDERWSGFYGSDGEFRDRVMRVADGVPTISHHVIRVENHVISDSETTRYGRKEPQDAAHKKRVRAMIAKDPTPIRLTFPWSRIL